MTSSAESFFVSAHDLVSVASGGKNAYGGLKTGDDVSLSIGLMAAISKLGWYARNKIPYLATKIKEAEKDFAGMAKQWSWLIDLTMLFITIADAVSYGVESVDKGQNFKDAADNLKSARTSVPEISSSDWCGTAATNYNSLVQQVKAIIEKMEDRDRWMADQMNRSASDVLYARNVDAATVSSLSLAQDMCYYAWILGPEMYPWIIQFNLLCATTAVGEFMLILNRHEELTKERAALIDSSNDYASFAENLKQACAPEVKNAEYFDSTNETSSDYAQGTVTVHTNALRYAAGNPDYATSTVTQAAYNEGQTANPKDNSTYVKYESDWTYHNSSGTQGWDQAKADAVSTEWAYDTTKKSLMELIKHGLASEHSTLAFGRANDRRRDAVLALEDACNSTGIALLTAADMYDGMDATNSEWIQQAEETIPPV